MKICWDNLEGLYLTRNGFLRKRDTTYIEKPSCKRCGNAYLTARTKQSDYCSMSCLKKSMVVSEETKQKISEAISGEKHSWFGKKHTAESKEKMSKSSTGKKHTKKSKLKMSISRTGDKNYLYGKHLSEEIKQKISRSHIGLLLGEKNPAYKGGVKALNIPLYETYAKQIDWCENTRCIIQNGLKILQVRCFYSQCRKWYTPTIGQVVNRVRVIKGNCGGNHNFYCSEECKHNCSIYGVPITRLMSTKTISDKLLYTANELRTWREEVLKRANYECEYCGEKATIAHHIRPKKLEPFFALDPDNGLACCERCHYRYAHQGECSTGYLAHVPC
jgi:5-methylcytosine-specific restriction endonuclease McrA